MKKGKRNLPRFRFFYGTALVIVTGRLDGEAMRSYYS
jgi:hypothetical protein